MADQTTLILKALKEISRNLTRLSTYTGLTIQVGGKSGTSTTTTGVLTVS